MSVVAIVGLGYVGLPLAAAFGKRQTTIGYDHDDRKIAELRQGADRTGEVAGDELRAAGKLSFTDKASDLAAADFIILAIPTPVDQARQPDFGPLLDASRAIGRHMKRGAIVIYESTVYPGATEEVCVPVLEQASGLTWKKDFHVAYSPERINPGDKEHGLTKIVKVVAGDDLATREAVARLYESIVAAGVHRTSDIRVAEAAKVIENTQRDLNIALMNELAIIFNRLGLDTMEVLRAAGTKWNFLPFRPGLVGGHCIGVDPYYLTYKAEMTGYHPEVILAGRRINDNMGKYVADQTIKQLALNGSHIKGAKINVLGLSFKENIPDLRNSRVIDLIVELKSFGAQVYVHDPVPAPAEAKHEYGVDLVAWDDLPVADAIVVAVAHRQFVDRPADAYAKKVTKNGCFIDVKSAFDPDALRQLGLTVWRL
ncbi:MAG: GDP-mannose dehydrogenase [Candidatus Muproteobacteria bacterium RBG_16_65_31]|uniref:GDP-mannose dehydrogenase n=1 Tax=Candidatus Muproteobacteria bacterium RBG_16_65_31 TaxID=1817759 RepID=A0A1F6TGR1_9PROT|nr:MAG: GDP-mannose dehydrogenase [Candidatus Muproteobacteria bacterium RBG_16_65_31]